MHISGSMNLVIVSDAMQTRMTGMIKVDTQFICKVDASIMHQPELWVVHTNKLMWK